MHIVTRAGCPRQPVKIVGYPSHFVSSRAKIWRTTSQYQLIYMVNGPPIADQDMEKEFDTVKYSTYSYE